jgi:hypothetical protein
MGGCIQYSNSPDKAQLRIALESNRGALQGCYADALQRQPDVTGQLRVTTVFEPDGRATQTQVTGAGDDALHRCVSQAIDDVWLDPSVGEADALAATFLFDLAPPPTPAGNTPAALLDAGDVDGALAALETALKTPHTPLEGCRTHATIVRAMMLAAPWLDDDRVRQALADLAQAARALPPADGRACVAEVEPSLQKYTRVNLRTNDPDGERPPIRYLERFEAVLPLAPLLEWGTALRWHRAAHLLSTPRATEAETELAELAHDPTIGTYVTEWLARRPTSMSLATCLR